MDIDEKLKRALGLQAEIPTQVEAGCTQMIQRLVELGPPETAVRQLGPYRLQEQIGEGGMGEVWRAHHEKLDRTVAIKRLKPQVIQSDELKQRFEREMRIAGNLNHPNIVSISHADEVDGVHYLAMEFVEGQTLSEILKAAKNAGQQLSVEAVCNYVTQIAAGLQYAHENGIVHRDIKPANVMLTHDGQVKILDMGLARFAHQETPDSELTAEHQTMGTLDYMPPEQLRDSRTAGEAADIYSLGCTLYKLLAGQAPFAGEKTNTAESKILAIATEQPSSVTEIRRDVPPQLSKLIDKMLLKDPEARPSTALEVIQQIQAIQPRTAKAKPQKPASKDDHGSSNNNGRKWLIGGGLFGALLLLGGVLLVLRDPEYGDLVIKGQDGVAITATKIDDPSEAYTFTAGEENSTLTKGRWKITIAGEGFDSFTLDKDVVEIKDRNGAVVRILKKPPVVPGDREAPTMPKEPERAIADWSETADWLPGPGYPSVYGLLTQQAELPGIPKWNIRNSLTPALRVNQGDVFTCQSATVDSSGRFLVRSTPRRVYVTDLQTGRILRTIAPPDRGRIRTVAASAGAMLCGVKNSSGNVRIYDARNQLVSEWKLSKPLDAQKAALRFFPDADQLLAWDDSVAHVLSTDGEVKHSIEFDDGQGPSAFWNNSPAYTGAASINSTGTAIAFGCNDGRIRVWDSATKKLKAFKQLDYPKDTNPYVFPAVVWSPDDSMIASSFDRVDGDSPKIHLWKADGTPGPELGTQTGWGLAWSPSGRYLVTGQGAIIAIDRADNPIRDLAIQKADAVRESVILQTTQFQPYWSKENRIDFVAQSGMQSYSVGQGRSFTPLGKRIPTPEIHHPAAPEECVALTDSDDFLVAYPVGGGDSWRHTPLHRFSDDGRIKKSSLVRADHIHIAAGSGRAWAPAPYDGPLMMFDREGQQTASIKHNDNTKPLLQSVERWNRDGSKLLVPYSNGEKAWIDIYTTSGERELRIPLSRIPTHAGAVKADPTGTSIAMACGYKDGTGEILVWNLNRPEEPGIRVGIDDSPRPQSLAWNNDGKWLAYFGSSKPRHQRLIHVPTGKQFSPPDVPTSLHAIPHWVSETQLRISNRRFTVGEAAPDGVVSSAILPFEPLDFNPYVVHTVDTNETVAWRQSSGTSELVFVNEQRQVGSIPLLATPQHPATPAVNKNNRVAIPCVMGGPFVDCVKIVDLKDRKTVATLIAYGDGETISVSPSGQLIDAPDDTSGYLLYVIQYPGGAEVALDWTAFKARIGLSKPDQAINWVLDVGGAVQVGDQLLTRQEIPPWEPCPDASRVVAVDLSRCSSISNEMLSLLSTLPSVNKVALSETTVDVSRSLDALRNVATLDLSQTAILDIANLADSTNLRSLNLSDTTVGSEIGTTLATMKNLEELDLSNTLIDEFIVAELAGMASLRKLNLTGTDLPPAAVNRLRNSLSGCDITIPTEEPSTTGRVQ